MRFWKSQVILLLKPFFHLLQCTSVMVSRKGERKNVSWAISHKIQKSCKAGHHILWWYAIHFLFVYLMLEKLSNLFLIKRLISHIIWHGVCNEKKPTLTKITIKIFLFKSIWICISTHVVEQRLGKLIAWCSLIIFYEV